ncbi:hypothetical protein SPLC1_S202250 [Arthrospira platensis C1]|nr:hypothetical protein SPLC1_S202250 [Arthrospira platensis C1]
MPIITPAPLTTSLIHIDKSQVTLFYAKAIALTYAKKPGFYCHVS